MGHVGEDADRLTKRHLTINTGENTTACHFPYYSIVGKMAGKMFDAGRIFSG